MATPFENKDGLDWAGQWDYQSDATAGGQEKQEKQSKLADYKKKIKSAASSGAKKAKSGTSIVIQWIKVQYQKKTQKSSS